MTIFRKSFGPTAENQNCSYIDQLKAELNDILHKNELALNEISDLNARLSAFEQKSGYIDLSLAESRRIAAETENKANFKAETILNEAQIVAAAHEKQMALLDLEIAELRNQLAVSNPDTGSPPTDVKQGYTVLEMSAPQAAAENRASVPPPESSPGPGYLLNTEADENRLKPVKIRGNNNHYSMQLVAFVNARHFVSFGGKNGPVHAHSWQAQIEVEVPGDKEEIIGFAQISSAVTSALQPYENTVLNYAYPFNKIQPTTENIAMYFFNCLEDALLNIGLNLTLITLWETPTRGIQVNTRNNEFDTIVQSEEDSEQTAMEIAAMREQAVAADIAFKEQINNMFELIRIKRPLRVTSEWAEGPRRPPYPWGKYAFAVLIITLSALAVYHSLLFPPFEQRFPWGSDTWGHLFKADYLYHEILKGNFYPQFTEYWYNGTQPFRYWAPLPYYVLALLEAISGDIFTAGNLFIVLCALGGGLSWLLLSRWMGIWPAAMSGVIWLLWQDNVRVALSEGNVPRILATALLPLLFAVFFRTLSKKKSPWAIIITAILIHACVLSHAMIGAIYCLGLFFFAVFLWLFGGCRLQDVLMSIGLLLVSIATTAWWLLPSLTGGITGLDVDAVKEAVQFVAAKISLNPFYRFSYPENFYWGISVILAMTATFITWRSKPAWAKSLAVCGFILIIITFPIIRFIYITLPLSHLLWPLRFTTFAILAILGSALTFKIPEYRQAILKSSYRTGLVILTIFMVMLVDSYYSVKLLVHTSTNPFDVLQTAQTLKKDPAWRVATIDLSQLGSAPSYTFSESAALEQVFGWAWQGAVTSRNIMLVNTGLEKQYYQFLFRSCIDLGATDLVVKDDVLANPEAFWETAQQAGYKYQQTFKGLSLWHSVDQPYVVLKKPPCLVIGRFAGTIALQFPEVEIGQSNYLDQYTLDYLQKYPKIILSGAKWTSKTRAERLFKDYIDAGGTLIVELSGMPENVLAKQPEFLGVYGEPVTLRGQLDITGKDRNYELQPLSVELDTWKTYVPMGLDQVDMEFNYYGNQAPVYGYKLVNGKKVWFLGSNLAYHSYMTGDPVALELLKNTLGLETDYKNPQIVPLQNYQASERGYSMAYSSAYSMDAIIPVAAIDGLKVKLDGFSVPVNKYENLLRLQLPAGSHKMEIVLEKTPVYTWGFWLTVLAAAGFIAYLFFMTRRNEAES